MELLLVFLSTAIGTVVGVAAVMMMQRKDRKAAVGAGSVLRTLQNTEWALASAGRDVEELRQKLGEREQAAHNAAQELESAQKRLLEAVVESEKETARRTEAERLAAEAGAQAETLAERVRQLETASSECGQALSRAEKLEAELADLRRAGIDADVQEFGACRATGRRASKIRRSRQRIERHRARTCRSPGRSSPAPRSGR